MLLKNQKLKSIQIFLYWMFNTAKNKGKFKK